jgi:hypothetical protein
MEDRRGFLKTLGKLGAALGITAAVATSNPTKGATPKPTNAASLEATSTRARKSFPGTLEPAFKKKVEEFEFGFTGFRSFEENEQLQKDVDLVYNQIIDNKHMALNPPMMAVPPHVYDFIMKKQAIADLDPFNWGAVFDIKWIDWQSGLDGPSYADSQIGRWEAHVKPRYHSVLQDRTFVKSIELPMKYVELHKVDGETIKARAKRRCYDDIVIKMRNVITLIIETDKKLNAPKFMSNSHITNRDKADLTSITK